MTATTAIKFAADYIGIVPLIFDNPNDRHDILQGDRLELAQIGDAVTTGRPVTVHNQTQGGSFTLHHQLSPREAQIVLLGGLLNALPRNASPTGGGGD